MDQAGFKSFPIQDDARLLTVMRYVERNPVRACFAALAEDWQWSAESVRRRRMEERPWLSILNDPQLPRNWHLWVDNFETKAALQSVRNSIKRGLPFGNNRWTRSSAVLLGLESTTRPRGKPKKEA